jgi:CheY-like chemotaxis protein
LPASGSKPAILTAKRPSFPTAQGVAPLGTILDAGSKVMKNILVIDDKEDVRKLIKVVLANYGFTVQEAASGQMGVKMIHAHQPDLVICDVNMPDMDGYETLGAVRESLDTAPIPFILMTGMVSLDGFRRGMVCGADDYLVKPFTPDELIEAVISRLARQTDVQMAADERAQKLHEFAARHSFPEIVGSFDDVVPPVAA